MQSRNVEIAASVGSGDEGIEKAKELTPDIILLDVKMPGQTGLETLKKMREQKKAITDEMNKAIKGEDYDHNVSRKALSDFFTAMKAMVADKAKLAAAEDK